MIKYSDDKYSDTIDDNDSFDVENNNDDSDNHIVVEMMTMILITKVHTSLVMAETT